MRGTHGREGGGDDGHHVASIRTVELDRVSGIVKLAGMWTYLWIPHTEVVFGILDVFQQDRSWPSPFEHEAEELGDDSSTVSIWVELAYTGDHDCPGNSAWIAENSSVYAATYSVSADARSTALVTDDLTRA